MTLKELKTKVLSIIEECNPKSEYLTDDPDIQLKMLDVINLIINEVSRMKKIVNKQTLDIPEDLEFDLNTIDNFYQLENIKAYDLSGNETEVVVDAHYVEFKEPGTFKVIYDKFPVEVNDETEDDYQFENTADALEVAVMGIAGTILLSDVSNAYGSHYLNRYETMLNRLDPRYNQGTIYYEAGDYDGI